MGFHKKHRHVKKINVVKVHKQHLKFHAKQIAAAKVGRTGTAIAVNVNVLSNKR